MKYFNNPNETILCNTFAVDARSARSAVCFVCVCMCVLAGAIIFRVSLYTD